MSDAETPLSTSKFLMNYESYTRHDLSSALRCPCWMWLLPKVEPRQSSAHAGFVYLFVGSNHAMAAVVKQLKSKHPGCDGNR